MDNKKFKFENNSVLLLLPKYGILQVYFVFFFILLRKKTHTFSCEVLERMMLSFEEKHEFPNT